MACTIIFGDKRNIKQFYLNRISYIYTFVQYYVAIYEKDSI